MKRDRSPEEEATMTHSQKKQNFKKQQKASEITEDELKKAEKDLPKLTDDSCKELDKLLDNKEKELMSV